MFGVDGNAAEELIRKEERSLFAVIPLPGGVVSAVRDCRVNFPGRHLKWGYLQLFYRVHTH